MFTCTLEEISLRRHHLVFVVGCCAVLLLEMEVSLESLTTDEKQITALVCDSI